MRLLVPCAFAVLALASSPAIAAEAAPAAPAARAPNFDPSTVTTASGEVEAIRRIGARRAQGVHLDLRTADGVLDVHLGPSWYVDQQPVKIEKGDRIEVTGSKVTWAGKPALIAQTVKKDDQTVTLRDASGIPAWSRRGRR